jgi:hypothetical protein
VSQEVVSLAPVRNVGHKSQGEISVSIRFTCACGKELQAQEEYAGRKTRCPDCSSELVIPAASTQLQVEPASALRATDRRWDREDENDDRRPERRRTKAGTSAMAVWSLVLGLLSFGCGLTGLPALLLGFLSLRAISGSEGRLAGKGLAIGGMVAGVFGVLFWAVLGPGTYFVIGKVRDSANQAHSRNNLKQMSLACLNYHDTQNAFPPVYFRQGPQIGFGPPGVDPQNPNAPRTGLSWRVAILPYVEEDILYRQFHLNEPWDSPHNKTLLTRMPKVYVHPNADAATTAAGKTHYRAFTGPGTMFDPTLGHPVHIGDIPDGMSNTILIVEAAEAVEWTKPDDLPFGPTTPLPKLGGLSKGGFNVAMVDGSTRFIPDTVSERVLRAAITRNGGEFEPLP